jgi:hypothetical protein
MLGDLMGLFGRLIERFKWWAYGRVFACPVCHLELSFADVDANGLVVCPVCGAVISLDAPYGHAVPVVLDMEILRAQPKWRLHPLAAHLPIGLFPFAVLGAVVLLAASLLGVAAFPAAMVERSTLLLLLLAVVLSPLAIAAGLSDWWRRYGKRPYRVIRLKIAFSIAFVALGAVAVALHASGAVFSPTTGLLAGSSPANVIAAAAYFALLGLDMIVVATLGHVGGNLVFGK